MNDAEDHDLEVKVLCLRCVGDDYLSDEIRREGQVSKCSYCGKRRKSYLIGDMADRVKLVFEEHYERALDYDYDGERKGEPAVDAIQFSADLPDQVAQDIQSILEERHTSRWSMESGEETEFSAESHYKDKRTTDHAWQARWADFETSLATKARFFDREAIKLLTTVFGDIEQLTTRDGRAMVIDAGPGTAIELLYRARVFQSDAELEKALERPEPDLGPPPARVARAGRMNAHGIVVFYGATDPDVALGEVRPPVGSRVAVGRFRIFRPLRLLDLTALGEVVTSGSVYDPTLADRLERTSFLRSVSRRMTRPVMPDDEALNYLPTQAIADFLATEATPSLDGILFPSVQAAGGGSNVILFRKAARVEHEVRPKGITFNVSSRMDDDEGGHASYYVDEEVPPEPVEEEPPQPEGDDWGLRSWQAHPLPPADLDLREPALRLDIDAVIIRHVQRVQFETEDHQVSRSRLNRDESPAF